MIFDAELDHHVGTFTELTAPRRTVSYRRLNRADTGTFEGMLSVMFFNFALLSSCAGVDFFLQTPGEFLDRIACLAVSSGLALGGARFGKGGWRVASLVVLLMSVLIYVNFLSTGIKHWQDFMPYWFPSTFRR